MLLPAPMKNQDHFKILKTNIEDTLKLEELSLPALSIAVIKPIAIRLLDDLKPKRTFQALLSAESRDKLTKYIFEISNYIYIYTRCEPSKEKLAQDQLFKKLTPIANELKKIKQSFGIKEIWRPSHRFSFLIPSKSFIKDYHDYRYEDPSLEYMAMIIVDDFINLCSALSIGTKKVLRTQKRSYSSQAQFETDYCLALISCNKRYFNKTHAQLALDIRNSKVTRKTAIFRNTRTIKYLEQVLYRNKKLFNSK